MSEGGGPHPSSTAITALYERHASAYDDERGRALMEQGWLDRFRAVSGPSARILDLGCGMGEPMAGYLIAHGHALTGVDAAPSLIARARVRFPQQRWMVADMRQLDLGERFGGILAWDSFFHLTPEDQRAMFRVFRQHAVRGAALMFTSGPAYGEAIGSYRGEELYHASLDAVEYQALLETHDFEIVTRVVEDETCGGHTVWLARNIGDGEVTRNAA